MTIFIITGMPASGKNIARSYAESRELPYFATGDIVRDELKSKNIEATPENTASLSSKLRGTDGMGVTRRALANAKATGSPVVFLEGMRSWQEIDLIRREAQSVVVAFLAPRELRRARIISRGRPDDSADGFDNRDMRELDYGVGLPIALADEYIVNTGTIEDALKQIDRIVGKYRRV